VTGTVSVSALGSNGEGFTRTLSAARRLSVAAVLPSAEVHFLTLASREVDFPGIALGTPLRETVERAFANLARFRLEVYADDPTSWTDQWISETLDVGVSPTTHMRAAKWRR
jgi:hypothetical protein